MYGYDYAYEPATEGLAEIGNWVTAKIQAAKDMIKKAIDAVKAKLKMMSGKAENVKSNSSEATQLVSKISKETTGILDKTIEQIELLYDAFDIIAEKTEINRTDSAAAAHATQASKAATKNAEELHRSGYRGTLNINPGLDDKGNFNVTTTGLGWKTKKGGMKSDISKNATSEQLQEWETTKREIGQSMAKQAEAAELVKADLKKLTSYGPLSRTATEAGYNGLREIFAGNEAVMNKWKRVKTATEWSVGEIHKILSKIMNLYDVGIKATDAFGKRLVSGNYRKDDGTRYDKKDLKAGNARWKSSTALDKEGREKKSKWDNSASSNYMENEVIGESAAYAIDRIYQAAYEDALRDIADAEYYERVFESVPDYMPGFDEYLEDAEYYPDEY